MRIKKQYALLIQDSFVWRLKLITFHLCFLVACGDKNQNEVRGQKSIEVIKNDSAHKQTTTTSDTTAFNPTKIDSIVAPKQSKNKPIEPPYPVCHPFIQTILLPNKQLKGPYNSEIGSGKNLVASIFYDNDLMMRGDVADG